jgi:hypothetical protein
LQLGKAKIVFSLIQNTSHSQLDHIQARDSPEKFSSEL